MPALSGRVMLAMWPLVVAYALPALAVPPGGTPRPPPEFTPPPQNFFIPPLPLTRSPLDGVTISNFVQPPKGRADGGAAPTFPVIIGGARRAYTIDLDSRFDEPLVRELPAQ